MKPSSFRFVVAGVVLLLFAVGFAVASGLGTISGFGWDQIALLCPVGALASMIASKALIPRAIVSVLLAVAACLVVGRAFCGWVCPVPLVSRARHLLKPKSGSAVRDAQGRRKEDGHSEANVGSALTPEERASLKSSCPSCASHRGKIDSRHVTLGAALLTTAVFGFPVFCLVCPIGLTFATIFLVILLFGSGDLTWTVVLAPVLLVIELFVLRNWCSTLCPISAFLSLASKKNKTFVPVIDDERCLETARGVHCSRCAQACDQQINPRHPELGAAWSECVKCHACVEACPTQALSMPFLNRRKGAPSTQEIAESVSEWEESEAV